MNEKLTIKEIKTLQSQLERDLLSLINTFSDKTGLYGVSVNMIDVFSEDQNKPYSTDLKVKINIEL